MLHILMDGDTFFHYFYRKWRRNNLKEESVENIYNFVAKKPETVY
jgi:hypothetical protein